MVYIIAEIGVNFFDVAKKFHISPRTACKLMIVEAKKNGANAVKFQAYKADTLVSKNSPAYWNTKLEPTKTQHELFKKHDSFNEDDFEFLSNFCKMQDIEFICTPFDLKSVEYLNKYVTIYKISSSDITNKHLLLAVGRKNKKILLSTGASTISEIKKAVSVINSTGNNDIVIMHCVLSYPTFDKDANLNMITSIKNNFPDYEIGYSDHTKPDNGMLIVSSAYLLGAKYIEKHYTLDKTLKGNDHYHSMDSTDLKKFKNNIAFLDLIIGQKEKGVLPCEENSRINARRSIYAMRRLNKGERISRCDIICKRPAIGINAMDIDKILGKTINKDIAIDEVLHDNLFDIM